MSIQSPVGTLDIKNATLRVGKLEVSNVQGIDTALNVTRANSVLIYDDQVSTTTFNGTTSSAGVRDTGNGYLDLAGEYVYWGQKLPNSWVMDFEMDIRSGTNAGPLYANVFSTTNTGGDGYSFVFNDSNDKITLQYDGTTLTETTVSGLFTASEDWQKVVINYERGLIAISVGGARKFYYKDIERETPYVNGEYISFSSASSDGRKIRDLRIVNGEKWVYAGESNVVFTQGSVGVGVTDPTAELDVSGTVKATALEGDGSAITNISSANVGDFASNVTRIENLETSNEYIWSNLASNVTRISTLETDLDNNSSRISTVSTDLSDNSSRISTVSTDLSDNSSRITTLESGDISISGDKTFTGDVIFESNVHMNGGNVFVANTINMTVSDPIIELGSNNLNTGDLGIIMTRHGATNSNIAIVYDESDDILRMGYTLGGASDSVISLDSNALAVSVQGNLEVGTANLFVDTVTGSVGIGTTSPGTKLHVNHDFYIQASNQAWNSTVGKGIYMRYSTVSGQDQAYIQSIDRSTTTQYPLIFDASKYKFQTGNVGIGTDNPSSKLHINPNTTNTVSPYTTGAYVYNTNTGDATVTVRVKDSSSGDPYISFDVAGEAGWSWGIDNSDGNKMKLAASWESLSTDTKMTIDTSGNVGIGTTSPGALLDLYSGSLNGASIQLNSQGSYTSTITQKSYSSSDRALQFTNYPYAGSSTAYQFLTWNSTDDGWNTPFVITGDGNVGIGTTSPSHKLNIVATSGDAEVHIQAQGNAGDAILYFNGTATNQRKCAIIASNVAPASYCKQDLHFCMDTASDLGDVTIADSKMVITNLGNVGIGTTSPLNKLDVRSDNYATFGKATYAAAGWSGIRLGTPYTTNHDAYCSVIESYNNYTSDYNSDLRFKTSNGNNAAATERMRITSAGNVGIGTASPVDQLHLTGNLRVDGANQKYYLEYRYQDYWTSNNNQTFTIPVTGQTARGLMLVEAKVIQVAANSSGERVARVKGMISNYSTGNFYMTVMEGENVSAFETYMVGASGNAGGTFTLKYQPATPYQQTAVCKLYLKIWIGGYTSSLGSLTRTDTGSNTGLAAPTFNSAVTTIGGGKLEVSGKRMFPMIKWDVDLTGLSNTNFYPIEFTHGLTSSGDFHPVNFKIYGDSLVGGDAFNENTLVGYARGGGWSDHNPIYDVHINRYEVTEHRFQGIYEGTANYMGGFVIYMRGGYAYGVITDADEVVKHTSAYTTGSAGSYDSTFAIKNSSGTDVSGTSAYISQLVNLAANQTYTERFTYGDFNVSGNVGIGTTSPATPLEIASTRNADTWSSGASMFNIVHNNGQGNYYGMSFGVSATHGDGVIQTFNRDSGTAQYDLRLQPNGGNVGIGTTSPTCALDVAQNGEGSYIGRVINTNTGSDQDARFAIETTSSTGESQLIFITTDGTTKNLWHISAGSGDTPILGFYYSPTDYNGGTSAGYITRKSDNASLNFTGQHRTFIRDVPFTEAGDLEGLIVSADQNKYIKMSGGIEAGSNAITTNESLPIVSLSTTSNDKKCFGVISTSEDPEERSDKYGNFVTPYDKELGDTRVYINSVGEGALWVTNINGSLESGDYITTSNVAGYGMRQDDDILHNYTVAKITMDCDFAPATQPVQVIKKELANVNYWVDTTYSNVALEEYSNLSEENRRTVTDNDTVTYQKIERTESTTEHEGWTLEVREELVNVLDEHGQIQWEDHPTETEKAYKIRYLTADGTQTDEANAVHIAAFVGCTYHCG